MPKLKEQPPSYARRIWAIIEALHNLKQWGYKDLAKKVGCSVSTVYNDSAEPDKIPLARLIRYFTVLGLPFGKIITAIEMLRIQMFQD